MSEEKKVEDNLLVMNVNDNFILSFTFHEYQNFFSIAQTQEQLLSTILKPGVYTPQLTAIIGKKLKEFQTQKMKEYNKQLAEVKNVQQA